MSFRLKGLRASCSKMLHPVAAPAGLLQHCAVIIDHQCLQARSCPQPMCNRACSIHRHLLHASLMAWHLLLRLAAGMHLPYSCCASINTKLLRRPYLKNILAHAQEVWLGHTVPVKQLCAVPREAALQSCWKMRHHRSPSSRVPVRSSEVILSAYMGTCSRCRR